MMATQEPARSSLMTVRCVAWYVAAIDAVDEIEAQHHCESKAQYLILMVRSVAKRRVSNHEARALRGVSSGPASFETRFVESLLRMR
jgi:hypothetical protein